MNLNKISVKQQGGQMIPNEPGMQQQSQVDPAIQQVSVFFKESIEQGGKPEEVVMGLMQQEVDQNTIVQALMSLGYQENDLQVLFQNIQEQQQVADPTPQQINQDPQQLARQQEIQEGQEGLNVNIDPVEIAKSGIEIKPENEGKFTAWAKARGMSVQEAAKKVMANKDRYPTRIVKMANFAKNAAGWNKAQDGVEIQKLSDDGKNIITERDGMTILTDNPYDNQDAKSQLQDIETQIKLLQQQVAIAKAQEGAAAKMRLSEDLPIDMTSQLNLTLEDFKGSDFYTGLETPEQIQMLMDNLVTPINNGTYKREGNAVGKYDAYRRKGLERLNQQKKGGEFKPHFMYKGKRKIRAKDMETHLRLKEAGYTHEAPKAQTGTEMLNLAKEFANKNNTTISDQNNNVIAGQENNEVVDNGLVSNPLYISPSMFHSGKRWSPAEAVGLVGELFTGIKSAPDTIAADAAANQLDKYSNAAYNVNVDLSEENLNAVDDYLEQYKIENPDATSLPDFSDKVNIKQNDIDSKLNKGVDWLKQNLGKLGESAQGIYDSLRTPGFNPKAKTGGEPLSFKEWVLQDPVTRSTANAQQEYQIYVNNFGDQQSPSADELYDEINPAELDIDTGGILGGISRLPNTAVAKGFGSISDWTVRAASNANDYLEDVEDDRKSAKAFRDLSLADNTQPTLTDPLFKRGKGPDVNTGLFPEIDQVTGYTTLSKYGGGTNNAGFKALPKSVQANILQNMQGGGVPGEQIPGMPTKEQLDLLVYMNNYKNSFMADGYKPSQSEFDAMDQKTKEMYAQTFPGNYKISSDTPTREELNAITNKMQMGGGGIPGQQIPGMPTKAQLDALTGANKIQFVPGTSQYEYLASLPEQSVDFQLPNFVKDSSYNQMLVTRLFNDSKLMKSPSQSENFQLDNFQKRMEMGGNPFNPLKLFTDDLEEYQKKGETPVRPRRSRSEIESEMAELQSQIDSENSRIEGFRSNVDKIYRGILTSKEVDDEQQRKNELAKILGDDSSINPNIFRRDEYNVVGLDTVPSPTRNWLQSRVDSGEAGYGCTSYGCGILRQAGATTAEGKPFPIISGNSQLNSMIERNEGGLGMQLMEPGFSDLLPGDRVVSNYSTSGGSGEAHTMIFTGDYDENGSPIMMENSGGDVSGGVSYRPLSSIKNYDDTSDPNSGLRVTRYVGSTSDLNNQLSALQSDLDNRNYKRDLVTPLNISLNPAPISMSETLLPKAELLPELLPMNNYGGERGEAAYLANRDRVIKREMAKAQQGGETINVDPKMLAKLIAAGADIEML